MEKNFFAIDLGATSGRTILGALTPEGLTIREINRFPNHLIPINGHFYWDIYELYRNILEGLRAVAREGKRIASIGIDTWGVDFVCVGDDGEFLRQPYAYRDSQTEGAPARYFERVSRSRTYELTGIQVMDFNTLFQLDTLRRREDSAFGAARKFLFIPDALSYLLTGQMVCEYTIASTSQLLNARVRQLEPELLAQLDLSPEYFGRFVYPGEKMGVLTEEIQRLTGLGPVPVVAVAEHDTASAVAAVPAEDKNFAYLSSGTWSLMGIEIAEPIITSETEALNFTNEGGVGHTIRLLKNICGMWLLERCRVNWPGVSYEELIAEANQCEPFRHFIAPDDPVFAHPEDMEKAIRGYVAERGQSPIETRGELVRCILESLAMRYAEVFASLRKLSPHPIEVLHIIGGGSRNELLNQWTANAIGIPVVAGPAEATAIGNLFVQILADRGETDFGEMRRLIRKSIPLKTYAPQHTEVWKAAYQKYLKMIQ